jgi:hypothetical protein
MLAFHFQFSDQARWKCEPCRQSGLDRVRRCAHLPESGGAAERPVWSRGGVAAMRCPKSLITAESWTWIEEHRAWKTLGGEGFEEMNARRAAAFLALEEALAAERNRRDE